MNLGDLIRDADLGEVAKDEVEEAISPITKRIDEILPRIKQIELKVGRLLTIAEKIDNMLSRVPFLKSNK
jgi:prefoldin subunit 5